MTDAYEFRPAETEDAEAINQLFLARYDRVIPGWQSWKKARQHELALHGAGYFALQIGQTKLFPKTDFLHVATCDGELVGFSSATADASNTQLARLIGLVVKEEHEGQHIGMRLEIERQGWADANDRTLYGHIAFEDERGLRFYRRNGYREVGTFAMHQTVFQLIEHIAPDAELMEVAIPWNQRMGEKPLVY